MSMFRFQVTPDAELGDPYTVVSTMRDVLAWERVTKGGGLMLLRRELRATDLYHIAWLASRRNGLWESTLAEFKESVDVEVIEDQDGDGLDPTQPAPSAVSTPSSPSAPASPRGRGRARTTAR